MDLCKGLDLVFYGDSITESWRGTDMNSTGKRSEGVDRVYAAHFSKYRSVVLAIAGERSCATFAHGVYSMHNVSVPASPICSMTTLIMHAVPECGSVNSLRCPMRPFTIWVADFRRGSDGAPALAPAERRDARQRTPARGGGHPDRDQRPGRRHAACQARRA